MDVFYAGSTSQPTCFFGSLVTSVSSQRQEGILVRYLMHASNARIAPHRHHQSQSLPQPPPPPTSVNSLSWLSTVAAACWTRTFIHRGLQSNQCLRLYSTQLIQRAVALALIYIHSSPMLQHSQCHYKYQRQHYRWAPLHPTRTRPVRPQCDCALEDYALHCCSPSPELPQLPHRRRLYYTVTVYFCYSLLSPRGSPLPLCVRSLRVAVCRHRGSECISCGLARFRAVNSRELSVCDDIDGSAVEAHGCTATRASSWRTRPSAMMTSLLQQRSPYAITAAPTPACTQRDWLLLLPTSISYGAYDGLS